MPPAMVTHWCFLVPILAMGLIAAPDLATAQEEPPKVTALGGLVRNVTLKRGPTGVLPPPLVDLEFIVTGNPRPTSENTITPKTPYVQITTPGIGTTNAGVSFLGDVKAKGTYRFTFTSQNVINGITNRASETVIIRVDVEGENPATTPRKISVRLTHGDIFGYWRPNTNINQPNGVKPPFTGADRMDRVILRDRSARIGNGNR